MQLQISREELKREAELLALLEKYETLALSTKEYNQGEAVVSVKSSGRPVGMLEQRFMLDPHCRIGKGQTNLGIQDGLNGIMAHHIHMGIAQCIALIKQEMKLKVDQ